MNKITHAQKSASKDFKFKYESLFRNAFDCIYVHDFEGNFLEISDSALKLFKYTRDEILSMNIKDILLADQLEIAKKRISNLTVLKSNSEEILYKIKNKSGEVLIIEVRSFLLEREGKPFAVQGIARDVTERIQQQEELKRSEEKFRLFFEHAADAIVISDIEGNILEVNDKAAELTGYSKKELLKLKTYDIIEKKSRETDPLEYGKFKYGKRFTKERLIENKDGKIIEVEVNGSILPDGRILGILRDISARKNLERKLNKSEIYYKSLIEEQVDLVCRFLPDTTWTFVNAAYCKYWDKTTEELVGKKYINYLPKEERINILYFLESFSKDHSVKTMENLTKSGIGESRWHLWTYKAFFDEKENIVEFQAVGKDITTQKKFEEQLKASEELHRLVLSNISDSVFLTDLNGNFTYVSPNSSSIFGYTSQEIYELKNIKNLMGDNFFSYKELDKIVELYNIEKTIFDKSGKKHHLFVNIKKVFINSAGILFSSRDVTKYKTAVDELTTAEEKYQSIFDNALEGIYQIDLEGRILSANKSLAKMLGYSNPDELINSINNVWEEVFVDKNLREPIIEEMERNNQIRHLEFEAYRKNGEKIWVMVSARNIRDENGKSIIYEGNIENISRRKRAEELLKKSEVRLQLSITGANQGIWDWNFETGEIYFNHKYYTMLGYSPNEFKPSFENWKKLIHPSQSDLIIQHQNEMIKNKDQFEIEILMAAKSGEYRWILSRGKVFGRDENGNPVRIAGTHQDITEKKIADKNLKQSEEKLRALTAHLEKVREKERKAIASMVHDELGQALTGIKLISLSISKNISNENEKVKLKLKEMNQTISSTIKSVQRISYNLRPKILETMGLIPAIESSLNIFCERTGINCRFIKKAEIIDFDEHKSVSIFRIIQECLTNIARHSKATKVELIIKKMNDNYVIKVTDNGIGVTREDLERETSLGIIGMKERAYEIGGNLEVKVNKDKGTTVRVYVPI